ncbi:hypothetical protein GRJ2_001733500 [Grus japonensis]|uniref:Uncharacterized protein n=1 Tax=Grus japonensis TaxID=30415 RepID=A0ABC9X6S1_GRUJA
MPRSSCERGRRKCERNNSADTKVSAEGGAGGAPGTGAEIPLQPVEKTMVRQAIPLQPMEDDDGADIHLQPVEDPTSEQVDALTGGCDPMGSLCWSRLLAGPVVPWRGHHAGADFLVGPLAVGDSHWSSLFLKDSIPWEGPHAGTGEECVAEGAAEMKCYGLTTTLIPHPLCSSGEDIEESGVKLSLGRREEWGKGASSFVFISYYPTLLILSN